MKAYIKILIAAFAAAVTLGACTEKFDPLERTEIYTDQDLENEGYDLITIAELKRYFWDEFPATDRYDITNGVITGDKNGHLIRYVEIPDNVAIKGKVISTDWFGNHYRSIYIQDETGAMEIKVGLTGMFLRYPPGTEVYVKAKGLILGNYRFNLSLGAPSSNDEYANGYIDVRVTVDNTIKRGEYLGFEPSDTLRLTSANIDNALNWDLQYRVEIRPGVDTLLTFTDRYLGCIVRFEEIRSHWNNVTGQSGYNNTDVFPNYLSNLNNTGKWAIYQTFSYMETVQRWWDYENNGGAYPGIEPPRPGTASPQHPNKPFLTYPTWAFRNSDLSYYGSSVWRLNNNFFTVRTSGYSNFALEPVPPPTQRCLDLRGDMSGAYPSGSYIESPCYTFSDTDSDILHYNLTGIMNRYVSSGGGFKVFQIMLNTSRDVVQVH